MWALNIKVWLCISQDLTQPPLPQPHVSDVDPGTRMQVTVGTATVYNEGGQHLDLTEGQAGIAVCARDPPVETRTVPEGVVGAVGTQTVLKPEPEPVCTYSEAGICSVHGQARRRIRPGKTWKRGKNGLYGWRYTSTVYYTCTGLPRSTHNTDEPEPSFMVLPVNSATFENFTELGGRVSRTAGRDETSMGMKSTGGASRRTRRPK